MVCLGIAGLADGAGDASARWGFVFPVGSSFPRLLCAPAMKESPTTPRPTPMNWPIDSIMPASSPLAARVDVWRRPARDGSRDLSAVAGVAPDHAVGFGDLVDPSDAFRVTPRRRSPPRATTIAPRTAVEAIVAAM